MRGKTHDSLLNSKNFIDVDNFREHLLPLYYLIIVLLNLLSNHHIGVYVTASKSSNYVSLRILPCSIP